VPKQVPEPVQMRVPERLQERVLKRRPEPLRMRVPKPALKRSPESLPEPAPEPFLVPVPEPWPVPVLLRLPLRLAVQAGDCLRLCLACLEVEDADDVADREFEAEFFVQPARTGDVGVVHVQLCFFQAV